MSKNNTQNSESTPSSDNEKTWWNQRTKLEKRLTILLAITTVTIIVFALFIIIRKKGISASSESCTSPGCLLAASLVVTHIDPNIDPCDDFFKFACGRFIEYTHGDIKAAEVQGVEDQVNRQLAEIIKEPLSEDDHYIIRTQKQMFQACMNETAVEEESIDIIKEHLEELKGWPVLLEHARWKEGLFDWTRMTYKLKSLGYHYEMMLAFEVIPDPAKNDKHIIHIQGPYIQKIKDEHKELYKDFMTDVAVAFGAERNQAKIEMEKVLDFMESLREVVDKNDIWAAENASETNYTAKLLSAKFTIDECQDFGYKIDWLDLLSNIAYPSANISGSDYVIFPQTDFMDDFFTLIKRTRKRIQANYMIWSMLESLMPFLPKEIKDLQKNTRCITEETPSKSQERFDYCKLMIRRSFKPFPASITYARRYLPEEKRKKVLDIFSSIKDEFKNLLTENTWMDDESREKSLEKVDNLVEIVGAPPDYLNDSVFDMYERYQNVISEDMSFLSMCLKCHTIANDILFDDLNRSVNSKEFDKYYYNMATTVNAMYSPSENTLIIPTAILQGLFYDPDRPMYLNYGSIGSIMGHELTHGFTKEGHEYLKDGKEIEAWTEVTETAYEERTECVIKDAENFDIEDTEERINGTLTLEENIADFTGIRVSYSAYKKWVKENGEELQLPGIDYTPEQLFWISAISYECYKLSGDKLKKGLAYDRHAHNSFRATAPMRNSEHFANDFGCPVDSNMNPSEKCQVF